MPARTLVPDDAAAQAKSLKRRSTLNLFRSNNHEAQDNVQQRPTTRSSARTNPTPRAASEDGTRMLARVKSFSVDSERSHSPDLLQPSDAGRPSRFSLARFRHASDSQLATRARQHAELERDIPPVPAMPTRVPSSQRLRQSNSTDDPMAAPTLMVTAPTVDGAMESRMAPVTPSLERRRSKFHPFSRQRQGNGPVAMESNSARPSLEVRRKAENRKSRFGTFGRKADPIEELRKLAGSRLATPSGEDSLSAQTSQNGGSSLTLPIGRKSESSRSETGWATSENAGQLSPERPKPQTHSSFPWMPRRNKQRNSLFPLPVHIAPPSDEELAHRDPQTPRASTSGQSMDSPRDSPTRASTVRQARMGHNHSNVYDVASNHTPAALVATSIHFAGPGGALLRTNSSQSLRSAHSSPALGLPPSFKRTRSSTMGSTSGRSDASHPPTPPMINGSGRTSTSTAGRSSFSNLVHLRHRFRHGSDPHSPRQGSPGYSATTPGLESHQNSLQISREAMLPEREEGETPLQYLARVEPVVHKSQIPSVLSKKTEEFYHNVMRSFMRKFAYFGDPLDMALRMLLMEVDLPKETQQIDRVLSSFADRYHECNPGVFPDPDKAYYMTFSLLLLHSDAFNKSNKRKMAKPDYVKNSSTEGVSDDVLECFYDNILYTPFIKVEDDLDIKTMSSRKSKKTQRVIRQAVEQTKQQAKTTKEPLDPYTLILENKLDILRPPLKGVISVDDPYSYLGTAAAFEKRLLKGLNCGIIQLESSRSRPDAFKSQSGIDNPEEANIGIIDLPIQKVGLLWRKDPKKRTARSPWQEWGAILTGAGLYFFKNSHFVKNFINQYEDHVKHGEEGQLTFKPTIQTWRADFLMPTENGVALHDSTYKKHKNAFVFFRHNNADEVFLADNEAELNDWLMKLNCQAAFKTYGIRPRGLLGGHYEGQRQRGMRRLESSTSASTLQTVQTPTGEVTIQSGKIDRELADQIRLQRREMMQGKIKELEDKLESIIKTERDQRRDASHLFILAPIQERTRTQLMHAAGKVSAQLKWSRIEIWRIKSHRDILAMDLEDEKVESQRRQDHIERIKPSPQRPQSIKSQSTASTAKPKPNGIERLSSNATASSTSDSPAKSIQSRTSVLRPATRSSHSVSQRSSMLTTGDDDVFQTPPENTPTGSPTLASPVTATPLSVRTTTDGHRGSIASSASRSPIIRPVSPSVQDSLDSPSISEFRTPMLTDAEAEKQREASGGLAPSPLGLDGASIDRPDTATSTEPEHDREPAELISLSTAGSPDSKRGMRRSLQKTLRDPTRRESSKDVHHHRNKGSKNDSISSTTLTEGVVIDGDALSEPGEGLKRHEGSFTVHGKKASVINFGGDWASMDAGERLKTLARNESQKDTERHAAPLSPRTMGSMTEDHWARATNGTLAPRRSSVSLKEQRRAVSHNFAASAANGGGNGHESESELGTARSLRKFSSSSGPPLFLSEDVGRFRGKQAKVEKKDDGDGDSSDDEGDVEMDVTPRAVDKRGVVAV